jgi:hypothetical protein
VQEQAVVERQPLAGLDLLANGSQAGGGLQVDHR